MKSLLFSTSLATLTLAGSIALFAAVRDFTPPVQAATAAHAASTTHAVSAASHAPHAAATLSFDITARYASKDAQAYNANAEQTVEAKVFVDGQRVRAESQSGDHKVVYIYTPPFSYKLLPASRSGLRYHLTPGSTPGDASGALSTLDPESLLPLLQNPGAIRAALQKQGVQRTGAAQLNGTPVDIYTSNNYKGKPVKVKAWLRRSDALPARLEMVSKKLSVAASWRNYQRGQALAKTLFAVPTGYHIRNAQSQLSE